MSVAARRGGRFVRRLAHRLTGQPETETAIWETIQLARHQERPYPLDYIARLWPDFEELHGDRLYGDDPAVVAGIGRGAGGPVAVIGHQKGRDTAERTYRNFGMPGPEGYRKAMRVMELAARFSRPILSFVDTPGAYPGLDAEERGQAEAIAWNLREMARLETPIIVTVTGEGGSGGALAIAVGDRVNMLEHSVYSVISPEGCASILFRDASRAEQAAAAMRITARDLLSMNLVDEVIEEPAGGAHVNHEELFKNVDKVLWRQLSELQKIPRQKLPEGRYKKFRDMGRAGREFVEAVDVAAQPAAPKRARTGEGSK
jgi:acetyl-CoA carboxylase carboxyl transferase subunit alpha